MCGRFFCGVVRGSSYHSLKIFELLKLVLSRRLQRKRLITGHESVKYEIQTLEDRKCKVLID